MPENMSKQTKRKITVEPPLNKNKDSQRRPSVFERLGTKSTSASGTPQASADNFCRHWVQNGNCPFGKSCKYANTHTLVSPSKQRAAKKDGDPKQKQGHNGSAKLHSTVVVKKTHSPDLNWENWDQTDLEYADEKVLEKRRQLLQRELELQMKREKEELRTKKDKKSKKGISSSSSTSGSSSSSSESSSSSDDSSSTSSSTSGDSRRRKTKSKKVKRDSSSSTSETDRAPKKKVNRNNKTKSGSLPSPSKKNVPVRRSDEQRPKRRDPSPPPRKRGISKGPQPPPRKRSTTPPGRNSSSHRRRSQTPPVHGTKGKAANSAGRSSQASKPSGKHQSPRPSRGTSNDRKDKQHSNRSVSPRIRDRDRDNKDTKDRDKDRDKEKERARSRSPKPKGKDRLSHSPRRNSRPPKDPRKKGSPDSGNSRDKNFRLSPAKSRGLGATRGRDTSLDNKRSASKNSPNVSRDSERRDNNTKETRDSSKLRAPSVASSRKEPDRKRDDREAKRNEVLSRDRLSKDRTSRETTLERSNRNNIGKDDLRRDDRKRDSQMLPGILEKTAQDRDFTSKSGGRDTNDSDRDRTRPASRDTKEGRTNRESREAAREKEREEALERCRERQREREREKEKAREFERDLPSLLSLATHNPTPVLQQGSRGNSKGPSKVAERPRDRGADRAPVRPRAYDRDRPFERTTERGLGFDRAPEREDYPPPRPREPEVRRPPPPEDKGYDSPFEGRRGRYSDQLDRSRYEDAPGREDPRTMTERRLAPVDPRSFPEDRRGRRDGRSSLEPIRGREWESSRGDNRELHDREQRELREQRRGYDREEPPHPLGTSIKGRDWDTRDYSDTRREWDGRGRRVPPPEWEAAHRGEWPDKELPPHPVPHGHQPHEGDWNRFPGPVGEWVPPERRGGWVDEWGGLGAPPGRPPPRPQPPHREDPLHHMPAPEEPPSHEAGMKKLHEDLKDTIKDVKDEKLEGVKVEEPGVGAEPTTLTVGVKRPRSSPDSEADAKKPCLDDSAPLEEVLSDISDDDADEILNREDSAEELAAKRGGEAVPLPQETVATVLYQRATDQHSDIYGPSQDSTVQTAGLPAVPGVKEEGDEDKILGTLVPKKDPSDARPGLVKLVDRQDDETIDNLGDFEEISDEELEEESKAGIGDALGVDWASLVAQSKPRERLDMVPGSARRRWDTRRVLQRLGVSHKFAGAECMKELTELPPSVEGKAEPKEGVEKQEDEEIVEALVFLHPVASIHVAMQARVAKRKALFASFGPYKRALSARRDLAIRRQLCNLPEREVTVDTPQPDIEQFRLSVQLFERSVSKG